MTLTTRATPLVSVIVPAYNYAHFLGETLASVQAQSLGDWECIVVDDGSQDNTREVAEQFATRDERIRYVHQENAGLSAARNTGVRESRGRYLQLLDADDWIEGDKLKLQSSFLEAHPEVDIVYGDVRYFTTEQPEARYLSIECTDIPWMPQVSGTGEALLQTLLTVNLMPVNAPLIRRSVLEKVGEFDVELRAVEDWHFWIRAATAGQQFHFEMQEGALALVRTHAQSMSKSMDRMFTAILLMREKVDAILPTAELKSFNRALGVEQEAVWGIHEGRAGHYIAGFRHLLHAGLRGPRLKWVLYALLLPLMVNSKLRPFISRIKSLLPGGRPAPAH